MCGITGYINLKHKVKSDIFKKMNNIIKHRGPDDEGYTLISKNQIVNAYGNDTVNILKKEYTNIDDIDDKYDIILGHRRLSILDLTEKGHQPMYNEDENLFIVFNGEIYNYIEIREELKLKGYNFHTNSDTEVIINAYKEWDMECVNKFNGMWAFAIYDKRKSCIFCSRDRFGVKPLYYYYDNEKFIFASEIKQILEEKEIERKANDELIFNFLFYGKDDYDKNTFFKNIYSLLPSHNMKIGIDFEKEKFTIEDNQYYSLNNTTIEYNEEKNVKDLKREIERSVNYRLRSDIPVGSCLSGGLDSSSIVTIATNQLKKEVNKNNKAKFETFTSCYDENPDIDERYYSKKVVERCNCEENLVFPNKENLLEEIKKVIWHHDSPFASLSIFAQWCVMKEANRKKVKVLLDGQGGDETLLGYERYIVYLLKNDLKKLKLKQFLSDYYLYKRNYNLKIKSIIQFFIYFSNSKHLQFLTRKIKLLKSNYMDKKFYREHKNNTSYLKNLNFSDYFELQKTEICFSNLIPLLRYEDRDSMAFSIETRTPFLDYKFIETAMKIPLEQKVKNGYTKNILRQAIKDDMDKEVVYRINKLGFAAPQKKWLNELDKKVIKKYLETMQTKKYFNKKVIQKMFKNEKYDEIRWKFLALEMWTEIYKVSIG